MARRAAKPHNATYDAGLLQALIGGLRPLPDLTVSEWAEMERRLPPEENEGGRYRLYRTPWCREIMDCLTPSNPVQDVVFMKAAQVGATEVGNNWLGYTIKYEPARFLVVMPTEAMSKRHSRTRISQLIDLTPGLRALVHPPRSRDSHNTLLSKDFLGGTLVMTGANSASALRSMAARYIQFEEIDAYPLDLDDEGDAITIAAKRSETFGYKRKHFYNSSPTVKNFSQIERLYDRSDQRKFYVPCPFCGHQQILVWAGVKWPHGQPDQAQYECLECSRLWTELQKQDATQDGVWIPAMERRPDQAAGFWLSSLYSHWVTLPALAQRFLDVKDDPTTFKTFVNLEWAETWEEKETLGADPTGMVARCEVYDYEVPSGVQVLTAGVDIQDDRLEVEIVGWGAKEESWSLAYETLWGDPSDPATWDVLDEVLQTPMYGAEQHPFHIQAAAVDTGGHHTLAAYRFCRMRARRRVWAIKGRAGAYPIWPRNPSRNNKEKVDLYLVGVDAAKEAIYSRLKLPPPGPGRLHFPVGYTQDYFEQLTAEVQRAKYTKGHATYEWWLKPGQRNEALDARVYAYAALHGLLFYGFRWQRPRVPAETARPPESLAPSPGDGPRATAPVPSGQSAQRHTPPKYGRVIRSSWLRGR